MIARRPIDRKFLDWNERWHAPYGSQTAKRLIPRRYWATRLFAPIVGMFAFQPNNISHRVEYPWAYDVADLKPGMVVMDLGAGISGFPFVLSRCGMTVYLVDPFLDYGGGDVYSVDPRAIVTRLNRAFRTNVLLRHGTLEAARFPSDTFDRIFCISVLEHFPPESLISAAREIERVLKPGGRFILTIDLFVNLSPFTSRPSNQFGNNISVRDFVELSGLRLTVGDPAELHGYPEFDADRIQARLDEYFLSTPVPALTQMLVLEKPVLRG